MPPKTSRLRNGGLSGTTGPPGPTLRPGDVPVRRQVEHVGRVRVRRAGLDPHAVRGSDRRRGRGEERAGRGLRAQRRSRCEKEDELREPAVDSHADHLQEYSSARAPERSPCRARRLDRLLGRRRRRSRASADRKGRAMLAIARIRPGPSSGGRCAATRSALLMNAGSPRGSPRARGPADARSPASSRAGASGRTAAA